MAHSDYRRDLVMDRAMGWGVAAFALVLFCYQIGRPASIYFDETHYVPAARALLARTGGINIEHPLFAKTLIAAGMLFAGDNAMGWRLPGALCAALGIGAVYWIALQLFHRRNIALCTALLVVFNQTYFIQARIAMLEMPMMALLLIGAGCLLRGTPMAMLGTSFVHGGNGHADNGHAGAADADNVHAARWRYAGAVALGLAIGSKWLAVPYLVLFLGLAAWSRWRTGGRNKDDMIDRIVPDTAKLLAISLAVYLATFWPAFFYRQNAMTLPGLFAFQFQMLASQRAPLAPHPYQSDWWQWPLMLRPLWYCFEKSAGAYQAILLIGNPVIYWGGLGVVLVILSGWVKLRTPAVWLTLGVTVFSMLIWIVIPKQIGFFYYYNLTAIWLCFVIAAACQALGARGGRWLAWITVASAVMFVYFYPIIAAQPLPPDNTWTNWVWMKSWY